MLFANILLVVHITYHHYLYFIDRPTDILDAVHSRIAQAAQNKQKATKSRFKKTDPSSETSTENQSEYWKIVNLAQKAQGDKDATTGACNVR